MSNIGDMMRNTRLADPDCGTAALARTLGITKAYLLLIEQGRRIPSNNLIIRWAQAVGKPWLIQQLLLWAIDARGYLILRFRQEDMCERRHHRHHHQSKRGESMIVTDYPYLWAWGNPAKYPVLGLRKGQPCRVLVRGTKNSCLIEFEDGYRVITSRSGIRKRGDTTE